MNSNLKNAIKGLNNRITISYFSLLLVVSVFMNQALLAGTESKKDSAVAVSSKSENLSVTFSGINNKAILEWKNNDSTTSHFIIQHSADGTNYDDVAVIFAPEDGANTINKFRYSDKINVADNKFVYYRLKMVDNKGEVKYSKVVVIAIDTDESELA